jgi:hypothetical protein
MFATRASRPRARAPLDHRERVVDADDDGCRDNTREEPVAAAGVEHAVRSRLRDRRQRLVPRLLAAQPSGDVLATALEPLAGCVLTRKHRRIVCARGACHVVSSIA